MPPLDNPVISHRMFQIHWLAWSKNGARWTTSAFHADRPTGGDLETAAGESARSDHLASRARTVVHSRNGPGVVVVVDVAPVIEVVEHNPGRNGTLELGNRPAYYRGVADPPTNPIAHHVRDEIALVDGGAYRAFEEEERAKEGGKGVRVELQFA